MIKQFLTFIAFAVTMALAPMAATAFERTPGDNDTLVPVTCSVMPMSVNFQNAVIVTNYDTLDQIITVGARASEFPDCHDLSYTFGGNESLFGSNDNDNNSATPD